MSVRISVGRHQTPHNPGAQNNKWIPLIDVFAVFHLNFSCIFSILISVDNLKNGPVLTQETYFETIHN